MAAEHDSSPLPDAPVGISIGQPAPDFTLRDVHGTPLTLSALRGQRVLLVFFPFAFSGICRGELRELQDNAPLFSDALVRVIAVSCDSLFALKAWAEQERYTFDVLSDFWPHGQVARSYGVFDEAAGIAVRGSFLLDEQGVVQWAVVNGRGQARDLSDYEQALVVHAEQGEGS